MNHAQLVGICPDKSASIGWKGRCLGAGFGCDKREKRSTGSATLLPTGFSGRKEILLEGSEGSSNHLPMYLKEEECAGSAIIFSACQFNYLLFLWGPLFAWTEQQIFLVVRPFYFCYLASFNTVWDLWEIRISDGWILTHMAHLPDTGLANLKCALTRILLLATIETKMIVPFAKTCITSLRHISVNLPSNNCRNFHHKRFPRGRDTGKVCG